MKSGRAIDEAKKRKSPSKSGKVGIPAEVTVSALILGDMCLRPEAESAGD